MSVLTRVKLLEADAADVARQNVHKVISDYCKKQTR